MTLINVLSRRQLFEMTAATAGLLLAGRFSPAIAQAARRIESMAPELADILDASQPIVELARVWRRYRSGRGTALVEEGGYLLFNDINAARRMKYTRVRASPSRWRRPTRRTDSLRDLQGRIVSAEHLTRRVTRTQADGSITVVANSFQGKRLLRPNDVVVKSDGSM